MRLALVLRSFDYTAAEAAGGGVLLRYNQEFDETRVSSDSNAHPECKSVRFPLSRLSLRLLIICPTKNPI